MRIIDIHAHAFADSLAPRAMASLVEDSPGVHAYLDGTTSDLLRSMDKAEIDASVVASILTKPSQFPKVLAWSKSIRSERLLPFPSIHPDDPNALDQVRAIAGEGFKGIKMHPYYQGFVLDEDKLLPIYEAISREGLLLLMHTGFDLAFERVRTCDPARTARVQGLFPELKFIASHLGAWQDWEEAEKHIVGKKIYMDISYSIVPDRAPRVREMILAHPKGYVLFGSDSPWASQSESVEAFRELDLGAELEEAILGGNAARLLGL